VGFPVVREGEVIGPNHGGREARKKIEKSREGEVRDLRN